MITDPTKQPWWGHLKPPEQAEYREAMDDHQETSIGLAYAAGKKRMLMERARRRMKRAAS